MLQVCFLACCAGGAAAGSQQAEGTAPSGSAYHLPSATAQQMLSGCVDDDKPLAVDIYMGGVLQQQGLGCRLQKPLRCTQLQYQLSGLAWTGACCAASRRQ